MQKSSNMDILQGSKYTIAFHAFSNEINADLSKIFESWD